MSNFTLTVTFTEDQIAVLEHALKRTITEALSHQGPQSQVAITNTLAEQASDILFLLKAPRHTTNNVIDFQSLLKDILHA